MARFWALLGAALASAGTGTAKISVHIVPHTHDDVGWLKTLDQYFTGQNNSIQHASVRMILDTVVRALGENPNRTFAYAEQAFFQRWWDEQGTAMRDLTRRLIKAGQLEMINGGWCMHDEATPFYLDMVDQTTLGHKLLMEEFGVSPRIGWQIDPFGHSATHAALLSAEVGFTGLFFGRIDYQDLALRTERREAEFVWRASPSLGDSVQVFAGLSGEYGGNYGPPAGFNWDVHIDDSEPVQDDETLTGYNVKSRVDDFVAKAQEQASQTRGNHIMWTMGSDFQYEAALSWFTNLDKIIKHVNADGRVQAFYSTPGRYLAAKVAENITWPLKTDDFFPYADGPHQFWTGYFTSRPAVKRYVRETSAILQVARQIALLGGTASAEDWSAVEKLAKAVGVAQHHDAVAGTEKQHVASDYVARLSQGRSSVLRMASGALARLAGGSGFAFCDLRNVSICDATQALDTSNEVGVILWNGLAQHRLELVEMPIGDTSARVFADDGSELPSQVIESLPSITNYGQKAGGSRRTLLFSADLPPLGFHAVRLVKSADSPQATPVPEPLEAGEPVVLENAHLALQFCDGRLCSITDKHTGVRAVANQSWFWYNASVGNSESDQKSGAYIFRPNQTEAYPVHVGKPSLRLFRGPLADEVSQTFGDWVSQRIRLAHNARHAEITFTVGPVPVGDNHGKEVVSRISTDLATSGECFTDSNGREMLKRRRDYRPSWELNQTEPVAGNYYPVTTAAFIRDARAQLTLLTDAAQAASGCVRDGELEFMVHRRLLEDDGRGVGEPLNETEHITPYVGSGPRGQHVGRGLVVRGRHFLTFAAPEDAAMVWRPLADRLYLPPLPFLAEGTAALARGSYSAVRELPPNVQVVTLDRWDEKVLLRLAHQFGLGEDAELSKPARVDLAELFTGMRVVTAEERGLTGAISRSEVLKRRIPWRVEGETAAPRAPEESAGLVVMLGPLQIKTFLLTLEPRIIDQSKVIV